MNAITKSDSNRQLVVGKAADQAARATVFDDYRDRRAANTLLRQDHDLALFANYLADVTYFADAGGKAELLSRDPSAWSNVTHGLIEGFVRWQLQRGYAVGSVNVRLSTVKQYAKLAYKAGAIADDQYSLIRAVTGYAHKEWVRVDAKRDTTRVGAKKAAAVVLTRPQMKALKTQPDTPQGRRDALLMCLLLDHGLRCGEIAALDVKAIDLDAGTLTFYRQKVDKVQMHRLSKSALSAARAWFESGDAPDAGRLLRTSSKGGTLGKAGMSERAITKRVNYLGKQIGIVALSAHDGRHSWATRAAREGTDAFALQQAGGWSSIITASRYVEAAQIANEGVNLGED